MIEPSITQPMVYPYPPIELNLLRKVLYTPYPQQRTLQLWRYIYSASMRHPKYPSPTRIMKKKEQDTNVLTYPKAYPIP